MQLTEHHESSEPEENITPTFVLMHYLGGSRKTWSPTLPYLEDTFTCVALDTPGFGDASEVEGYSVADMAAYFDHEIRSKAIRNVVLVGHSMTGKVALVMASMAPDYLRGVALVTPSPPCAQPITEAARNEQLAFANRRDQAEPFVDKSHVLPLPEDVRELAIQDVMRCNPLAFRAWAREGMDEDWTSRIGKVQLPSLIICGSADDNVPNAAEQRRMTLAHLPHGTLQVIPGAGHLLPMEAPRELATLLRDFAFAC